MNRSRSIISAFAAALTLSLSTPALVNAQEEKASPFSAGGDFVSSYVWRGTKFGTGPAIQPYLDLTLGNFSIGGWGSYCFTSAEAAEADLYVSYGFDFGLSVGLTDYYFPGTEYFDFSTATGSHAFEINLGYEVGGLSLAANYFLNEAGSAGTAGGDMYFELGYSFENVGLFLGAGDGWHTPDEEFAVCNIGISTEKELAITESFSLPVSGALILNPATEQFNIVVGISF
ncbi:MAG: TorF family putative porin [Bacteroidales bacterium]